MSKNDISEKLYCLLTEKMPFIEEAHVVYFLVEVRKLQDRENDKSFPLLRFYCDWAVHTAKDQITPAIRRIMEDVFRNRHPKKIGEVYMHLNYTLADFSQMQQVKKEIQDFLKKYGLPTSLVEKNNWVEFIHRLVNILADQPINNPCEGIKSFSFKPSPMHAVIGQVGYEKNTIEPEVQDFTSGY